MAKYRLWCTVELYVPVEMELKKDPRDMLYREWSDLEEKVEDTFIEYLDKAGVTHVAIENWMVIGDGEA
ncbi:hypothetical protein [Gelria sp. Kuro-4]|uniref:hypothetical protein n=1 Tax=Gelria sp. Kuro-4 TaxID=2796927 RepID=UPI001BEFF7E2|nr:hypothetical protein [Gelria sp. Kuro-4]BCV23325.1 hypothetical protein kuro4_00980 [Gelria sp. Kuro-4]